MSKKNTDVTGQIFSRLTGVSWKESISKYQVIISKDGKNIYLGVYSSFEQACKVREKAEQELYGYTKE